MSTDKTIVRVLRLVEYEGPRYLVEEQLKRSLHGTRTGIHADGNEFVRITAVTLDQFPEILEDARTCPAPDQLIDLQNEVRSLRSENEKLNALNREYRDDLARIEHRRPGLST